MGAGVSWCVWVIDRVRCVLHGGPPLRMGYLQEPYSFFVDSISRFIIPGHLRHLTSPIIPTQSDISSQVHATLCTHMKVMYLQPLTKANELNTYYYYWYSAIGPVWAETRVQSGDWYSSGTLHPGQVLRGSLPLLSPAF